MNNIATRSGILFVLSAPSGGGKTTLRENLISTPDFVYLPSCTTRSPRPGEVDGESYYFLEKESFKAQIAAGEFLEYAEVHGNYYGTRRENVLEQIHAGRDVLIDVDIAGAAQIRACTDPIIQESLVDVFVMPPSICEIERRLHERNTESEEQLATRIANATGEMKAWTNYRYTIMSGTREEDVERFRAIMIAERNATSRIKLPASLFGAPQP